MQHTEATFFDNSACSIIGVKTSGIYCLARLFALGGISPSVGVIFL